MILKPNLSCLDKLTSYLAFLKLLLILNLFLLLLFIFLDNAFLARPFGTNLSSFSCKIKFSRLDRSLHTNFFMLLNAGIITSL